MNCYLHPETPATAYCRSCGRPLCGLCQRTTDGTVFCADHSPAVFGEPPHPNPSGPTANPYFQSAAAPPGLRPVTTSPPLAFILGWIPGVGAIYNGQYVKGLVHAVIFGLIVSLLNSVDNRASEPFLGILLAAFIFYMAFEAFHTAKKRQIGAPVDEWSSLVTPSAAQGRFRSHAPIGPIVLIAVGVLFLLDTLNIIQFNEIGRFWPVLLIALGAIMLYNRVSTPPAWTPPPGPPNFSGPSYSASAGYPAGPGDPSPSGPATAPFAETRHE